MTSGARRRRFVLFATALVACDNVAAAPAQSPSPAAGPQPGLVAQVADRHHAVALVVAAPHFVLDARESLHPTIGPEFTATWTGQLSVLQGGRYWIDALPAEVLLDGKAIPPEGVTLAAGLTPIRMTYRRKPGIASLQLRWRSEHFPLEPMPSSALSHRPSDVPADEAAFRLVERGRMLIEELGCVGCHASRTTSLAPRPGPRLDAIGGRTNPRWIAAWLANPTAFRVDAAMPTLPLNATEQADVAAYLSALGAKPRASAQAARAAVALPGPRASADLGRELFKTVGCAQCHRDGTALALAGLGSKYSAPALAAYLEAPSAFHPGGRMPSLLLTAQEAAALAASLTLSRKQAFEAVIPDGDRKRGRALVESRGCLGCHSLADPGPLRNHLVAPALADLKPERGCLADAPHAAPVYRLTGDDREALRAFVTRWKTQPDVAVAPVHELARRVEQLRCTACHALDHARPGRAPAEAVPALTMVGTKLRTDWIVDVLAHKRRVRDFLEIRMPHYDRALSRPLAVLLAKASGTAPLPEPIARAASPAAAQVGHGLLGTNPVKGGLGCIGCHGWGQNKALGEMGPQLSDTAARLRPEFFRRWMHDPARIASGTSMPNYFAGFEPADATRVVDALWSAFSLQGKLPVPEGYTLKRGLAGSEERPLPLGEAIVVRWDMPEATPAAIAVGLPGKLSFCFDAGESRLRYAWKGGFLDLSGTLLEKVRRDTHLTPTAELVGEVFYRSAEFPFRAGTPDHMPTRRFRGYRLEDGVPEFMYDVDGVEVRERLLPSKEPLGLRRRIVVAKVDRPLWLMDARFPGDKMEFPRGAPSRLEVIIAVEPAK